MPPQDDLWALTKWRAKATPEREMLVDERGRRLDFAGFRAAAETLAAGLARLGIGEGVPVTWQMPTTIETLLVTVALARLGAVQNPVMPVYGERELAFVARQTGARYLLVAADWKGVDLLGAASRVAGAEPHPELVVLRPDELPNGDINGLPDAVSPTTDPPPIRWIFYTSGSTSEPKGVRHTDRSVIASGYGMGSRIGCNEKDRIGLAFPAAHVGGCGSWLAASLLFGSALVLDEKFDRCATLELFARERVTIPAGGTAFSQIFLAAQRERPQQLLLPDARILTAGAARKPPTLHHEVETEMGGVGLMSGYGLTEAPLSTMTALDDPEGVLASTEGRAVDGMHIRIVSESGTVLGPDEAGEIRLRGRNVMLGYVDETLNSSAFDVAGYFRTGDLGSLDTGGNLTVTGRLKDVIIRNGENISASEVEDLLLRHASVAEAAVVGLPHPQTGEQACAVVVLHTPDQPPTLAELNTFLSDQGLVKYKLPERLHIVTEIPRNPTGKPMKDAIRAELTG